MFRFPRTNFHELNLDWILNKVKELDKKVQHLIDSGGEGGVTSVNGATGDVVLPIPQAFNGTPAALGTANPGVSDAFARGDHVHPMPNIPTPVNPYTNTPAALGTASPGVSDNYARGDHVHQMPSATNVGAIPAPSSPATGAILVWDGSAWTAQTPSLILLNPANGGIVPTNKMTLIPGNFFMNVKNGYVALTMRITVNGTWTANQPNVVATLPQSTIDIIGQTSVNTLCKIGNSQIGTININTWGGGNTISVTPTSVPASGTEVNAAFITFPVT